MGGRRKEELKQRNDKKKNGWKNSDKVGKKNHIKVGEKSLLPSEKRLSHSGKYLRTVLWWW